MEVTMKLDDMWILDYMEDCKNNKGLSENTLRAYKGDLLSFKELLNEYDMEISKDVLKKYLKYLNNNYKPKTAQRKIASLRAFFRHLVFEDVIDHNPLNNIKISFGDVKTLPRTIDLQSISIIKECIYSKYKKANTLYAKELFLRDLLIFELLIKTGIRVSELCEIKVENLCMIDKTIIIVGKGKKERILFLGDDETWKRVTEYISIRKIDTVFLFSSMKGNNLDPNSVRHLLIKYGKKLDIDKRITPHKLRHTFATELVNSDVDIRVIQRILGHSSITTTSIYADVSQEKIKQVLNNKNPMKNI